MHKQKENEKVDVQLRTQIDLHSYVIKYIISVLYSFVSYIPMQPGMRSLTNKLGMVQMVTWGRLSNIQYPWALSEVHRVQTCYELVLQRQRFSPKTECNNGICWMQLLTRRIVNQLYLPTPFFLFKKKFIKSNTVNPQLVNKK